jgi:adenosylcobyric acid synthase
VPALMVQGASSSAGKSLLATALCRLCHRRGIDVAPFKAQNMSNNARVVGGGEIGTAQYLQALAAGLEPDVRMNPILVKPEGDSQSQVIVLGKPDLELSRLPWRARSERLWPPIEESLKSLQAEHELLLIEGAGSPAEINLRSSDLANMRTAKATQARVVLLADIDRGGAFAHLYGTWALLPPDEQALLAAFVLNKFRGTRALLPPGPQQLEQLTGVPTIGVLPWLAHGLPDEDGAGEPEHTGQRPVVAVVRYPTASNLDEFRPLEQVADLRWASIPADLAGAELVVLPGSKHVTADLAWLTEHGFPAALAERIARGGRVLAICGGLQMLGERVIDEGGVDGSAEALGMLPLETTFARAKRTEHTTTHFPVLCKPWTALSNRTLSGYEIRHGHTTATAPVAAALPDGRGYISGPLLGIYLHGLFEQPEVVTALIGASPGRSLNRVFDELADAVEEHLALDQLLEQVAAG